MYDLSYSRQLKFCVEHTELTYTSQYPGPFLRNAITLYSEERAMEPTSSAPLPSYMATVTSDFRPSTLAEYSRRTCVL
jgi:hypothetical protein